MRMHEPVRPLVLMLAERAPDRSGVARGGRIPPASIWEMPRPRPRIFWPVRPP